MASIYSKAFYSHIDNSGGRGKDVASRTNTSPPATSEHFSLSAFIVFHRRKRARILKTKR
ncbi:MAG: hypothetical protein Q7K35_03970 [bacterium]|nr:hypothetical protein [bacterium]